MISAEAHQWTRMVSTCPKMLATEYRMREGRSPVKPMTCLLWDKAGVSVRNRDAPNCQCLSPYVFTMPGEDHSVRAIQHGAVAQPARRGSFGTGRAILSPSGWRSGSDDWPVSPLLCCAPHPHCRGSRAPQALFEQSASAASQPTHGRQRLLPPKITKMKPRSRLSTNRQRVFHLATVGGHSKI